MRWLHASAIASSDRTVPELCPGGAVPCSSIELGSHAGTTPAGPSPRHARRPHRCRFNPVAALGAGGELRFSTRLVATANSVAGRVFAFLE